MKSGSGKKAAAREPQLSAALRQAVEALRAESLQRADGELIGSEDEVLARHSVSRPTLRQAAALVAQEQLLQVRRGVGGGYIARRPTGKAVAHMASIYLRAHGTSLEEIIRSVEPIRVELVRLAAINLSDDTRSELQDFLERDEQRVADDPGYRSFIKSERDFGRVLGSASGNRVMALFLDILYDLAGTIPSEHDTLVRHPERVEAHRQARRQLAQAILEGDPDIAELRARRVSDINKQWMMEDLGRA